MAVWDIVLGNFLTLLSIALVYGIYRLYLVYGEYRRLCHLRDQTAQVGNYLRIFGNILTTCLQATATVCFLESIENYFRRSANDSADLRYNCNRITEILEALRKNSTNTPLPNRVPFPCRNTCVGSCINPCVNQCINPHVETCHNPVNRDLESDSDFDLDTNKGI